MIELRFHRDLYAGEDVDAAIKAFAAVARCEQEAADDAFVVRVEPLYPKHARRIVGELGNYALARTIERGGRR
ncbi:MAG: HxsD-like protein [Nannocystaceae bacterium]